MNAMAYSPWGAQYVPDDRTPANDNIHNAGRPLMIGLTGLRNVGKSTVADLLSKEFGFTKIHAFASGKEAAKEYFIAIGFDADDAWEMVYGDLKDVPCDALPGGVAPRYFLEKFGHFMGHTLGVEWTLGQEVRIAQQRSRRIVVESLVYEAPWFKARGGVVVRLERPGHVGPAGVESDAVQALVAADATIAASSVDELRDKVRGMVQQMVGGG